MERKKLRRCLSLLAVATLFLFLAGGASGQEAEEGPAPVQPGNTKASVKLYGQVNKALLYTNDGDRDYFYVVDNDNSSTRIGVLGAIKPNDRYDVGTRIEMEYQTNPSNVVSQTNKTDDDTQLEKRHLDLFVTVKDIGKFSIGWGSTASDGTSEVDMSGTSVIGYSSVNSMAGGQLFYNSNTGALSTAAVKNVFTNMDGFGRDERIRYDSPTFSGLKASVSYITDGAGDIAFRYSGEIEGIKLAAALAYAVSGSTENTYDNQVSGSVSALLGGGFNLTVALGSRNHKADGRDDASFFYTKLGYQASLFDPGLTSFAVDYGRNSDVAANGDDADTIGLMAVQDLEDWGTEAYAGYRFHSLDRTVGSYKNINALMLGARVKF